MNVLILCHGNINRSPFVAAVLEKANCCAVRSRGFAVGGRRAPKRMREAALRYEIDLTAHRSKTLAPDDLAWADYLFYMDGGQRARLDSWHPPLTIPTRCVGNLIGRMRVPDPNYESDPVRYAHLIEILMEGALATVAHMRRVIQRAEASE